MIKKNKGEGKSNNFCYRNVRRAKNILVEEKSNIVIGIWKNFKSYFEF